MSSILRIEHLSKTYSNFSLFGKNKNNNVLKDINLTINENESIALMGSSGCGKTTLAKIILGLETATTGKIFLFDKDISSLSKLETKNIRSDIGFVAQDPFSALDPKQNVEEILSEPFIIHKRKYTKETLIKALKEVALQEDDLQKFPHQFSGGQRQRLNIARALMLKPKLLIADEPSSSLDVSVQAQIINLLVKIRQERALSLLFISHDFALCKYLCHNIFLMRDGQLTKK